LIKHHCVAEEHLKALLLAKKVVACLRLSNIHGYIWWPLIPKGVSLSSQDANGHL